MPIDALILVPPLFKTLNQPLLGPAMLVGAGRAAGHTVESLDLNQAYLRSGMPAGTVEASTDFVGDHNRPTPVLSDLQKGFARACQKSLPQADRYGLDEDPTMALTYEHRDVLEAAQALAQGPHGAWIRERLVASPRPALLGISVFWSGQVLFALAASIVAKALWADVAIVWGGPHVTALEDQIPRDPAYGCGLVDGFVFGYAERTWVSLLEAVTSKSLWPAEVVAAGSDVFRRAQGDASVLPVFDKLDTYGWGRLCLPAQASRGCAYGRCTYCTYPAVEGRYRVSPLDPVEAVVAQAEQLGATVAFKDALVVPKRLVALADQIAGRVQWSVCTKLHRRLGDIDRMRRLRAAGLHTVEIGLETLTEEGQLVVDKRQSRSLFLAFLDAADAAGIAVVVNYMTGLPGVGALEEQAWLQRVRADLTARPNLISKVEYNTMQVERRSALGQRPGDFQIRVVKEWPWASVVAWRMELSLAA